MKPLKLRIELSDSGTPFVRDHNLKAALDENYDNVESIQNDIDHLLFGSTRLLYGVYPWDLKCVFDKLGIHAEFYLDGGDTSISIDPTSSGIHDVHWGKSDCMPGCSKA